MDLLTDPSAERLPQPGEALPLRPGLHWVRMPLPFRLNHINLWLIAEDERWALVDTGFGIDATLALWEQVLEHITLSRIIVTHFHPDHVGCAAWLSARTGASVWMSEAEFLTTRAVRFEPEAAERQRRLDFWCRHGLDATRRAALAALPRGYDRGVPSVPDRFQRLRDGDQLQIGTGRWRVCLVSGHAPGQALLVNDEERMLIAADQVLERISPNVAVWPHEPAGDPLADYLRGLDRLEPLDANTLVLPSHGRPFVGLHARCAALRRHHAERLTTLLAALSSPATAVELMPVLFSRDLDLHELGFAIGETLAHLARLEATGWIAREETAQAIRFRRLNTPLSDADIWRLVSPPYTGRH